MTSAAQRLRCLPSPNEIKTDLREDLALMVHTREQMVSRRRNVFSRADRGR